MSILFGIVLCIVAGFISIAAVYCYLERGATLGVLAISIGIAGVILAFALGAFGLDGWWVTLIIVASIAAAVIMLLWSLWGIAAIGVALVLALMFGVSWSSDSDDTVQREPREPASTTTQVEIKPASLRCASTWEIKQVPDNEQSRWFLYGIDAIRTAATPAQAREAANTWFKQVKADPELLAGTASWVVKRTVDPATLYAGECISPAGAALAAEIELQLVNAVIAPAQAPSDGTNSGMSGGAVVVASQPGVSGDRTAIEVRLKDGTVFWVMARCGQIVSKAPPGLPKGPTDEKPKVPPTTVPKPPPTVPPTVPPTTPPTTVPEGGKNDQKSPVSPDRNAPDERDRPKVTAPPTVIRPPATATPQPTIPPTVPDPPQVKNPEPIAPGVPDKPPTAVNPSQGNDSDGDGIPD